MENIINEIFKDRVINIENLGVLNSYSISNKIAFGEPNLIRYKVNLENEKEKNVIFKYKSESIIKNGIHAINPYKSNVINFILTKKRKILGYDDSTKREIIFYKNIESDLKENLINVYGGYMDCINDKFLIVMDEMIDYKPITKDIIKDVIDIILKYHIKYYNDVSCVDKYKLNNYSKKDYKHGKFMLKIIFNYLDAENNKYFKPENVNLIKKFICNIDSEFKNLKDTHKTLTHNDFNQRNIFIAKNKIYIYDWELATFQNPEHDVLELLISMMHYFNDTDIIALLDYYKNILFKALNIDMSDEEYRRIIAFNVMEFSTNRLSAIRMADKKLKLDFVEQLVKNTDRMITLLIDKKYM